MRKKTMYTAMNKIGEKKFTFSDIPKFYRIPISCCEDHSYLNVGKNSVVKIYDQKPLHTWTLTHPNYFTSPVVYCNENLYSVMNNNVIIKWSVNEDSLKNAEKIKFQEPVFAIIPVPGRQPLVLLKSGNYATVDGPQPQEVAHISEKEIIWADVSIVDDNIKLYFLICDEENEVHTLYSQNLNCVDKMEQILSHPKFENTRLKAWCLKNDDSLFLSVWSNGMILLHKDQNLEGSNIIHLIESESLSSIAVTFIDATHVGIALHNVNHKEITLEIWDTKFCVLKTKKNLTVSTVSNLQIASNGSHIFLYFNKEVSSFPVHLESSTLAAAMGKSLTDVNQFSEFSWDETGELLEKSTSRECEPMDIVDSRDKCTDTVEEVAQRLLTENLQYLMYIPESELVKLLQLAVSHCLEKGVQTKDAVLTILNIVFSASFNDIYLVKYLRKMNLEDTLVTLELLLAYLNQTVEMSDTVTTERPLDFQIVNWTCLIIQSHMESLLLSKDKKTRKLLRKVEKAVCAKTEEYQDYEDIHNYFTILQKKQSLPEKCSAGKYFIDYLDI